MVAPARLDCVHYISRDLNFKLFPRSNFGSPSLLVFLFLMMSFIKSYGLVWMCFCLFVCLILKISFIKLFKFILKVKKSI